MGISGSRRKYNLLYIHTGPASWQWIVIPSQRYCHKSFGQKRIVAECCCSRQRKLKCLSLGWAWARNLIRRKCFSRWLQKMSLEGRSFKKQSVGLTFSCHYHRISILATTWVLPGHHWEKASLVDNTRASNIQTRGALCYPGGVGKKQGLPLGHLSSGVCPSHNTNWSHLHLHLPPSLQQLPSASFQQLFLQQLLWERCD